jgi:hypothetical protein
VGQRHASGAEGRHSTAGRDRGGASSKWVCSVCYFTENLDDAQSCEVCDSPNYNNNKVIEVSDIGVIMLLSLGVCAVR